MTEFIDKHEAAKLLRVHYNTIGRYRKSQTVGWIEGVHYAALPSGEIRYNKPMLLDWLTNRHDPQAHLRAIEIYQASLLSNQRRKA
ncbi:MAG TPA: hypothetical protein V6D10_05905 [Trichocoleus sp.]|jgi:hypothetical protein